MRSRGGWRRAWGAEWLVFAVLTRFRQLAPVGLVLGLTLAGFFLARAFGNMDARQVSQHRADIAATQVRDRVTQASTLADGVRRFLVGHVSTGVSTEQFSDIGGRWLSPVGLPAAAWVERVGADARARYERRTGHRIVARGPSGGFAPVGAHRSYLPATLATGIPPMSRSGIDLQSTPGIAVAIGRPQTAYRVTATSLGRLVDGTRGLFLVQSAQRVNKGIVEPGYVVLFVPASWLLAAADTADASTEADSQLRITVGRFSAGSMTKASASRSTFTTAGQQFAVEVPRRAVHGAAQVLPWIILAAGLVLAALVGALRVNSARRAKAKAEVDRLFTISPDLIVVAGFDGYFKRVNPAFEARLGYSDDEALTRPFVEFVHPDDRARTENEYFSLREGGTTISFENRYLCKNGSHRWIEWTAIPVLAERLIYAVGRDVSERRQAENNLREAEERNWALAEEQAALRRVATLVARGVPQEELFAAVTEEVGQLLPVGSAAMGRQEPDGMFTTVAAWTTGEPAFPVGRRWMPGGKNVMTMVIESEQPARLDDFADASGPVGVAARKAGYRSAVGTPIVVEGRLWGVMTAASSAEEPLPAEIERRLASFTELVATAIANTESRAALARLAGQQAALRRVATLVAESVPPKRVFSSLCEEVNRLLDAQTSVIVRLEIDGTVTVVASAGITTPELALGTRLESRSGWVLSAALETGRPARKDDYDDARDSLAKTVRDLGIHSSVAVPIVVEGRVWGVIVIGTVRERFPENTIDRLDEFTALAATAIANADSRAALARLANQQAALRRVATLVAESVPPARVFSALSEEVSLLVGAEATVIGRLGAEGRVTVLAVSGTAGDQSLVGTQFEPEPDTVIAAVLRTGRSARKDDYSEASQPARRLGMRSGVGVPIVVEGAPWGVVAVGTVRERFPADTGQRLEEFTELAATAIANAENRSALAASRARIVAASDEARRRIERDLHDGTQQRLVSLGLDLRLAESIVPPDLEEPRATIGRVAGELNEIIDDLREISRGIHPAILSEGGLGPALRTLARRSAVPVELHAAIEHRLAEHLEVAGYYVVSEALANATKHANASRVKIDAEERGGSLRLSIRDDGVGGADPAGGSGLLGLRDRVEALGGSIELDSPPGEGTHLVIQLPLELGLAVDDFEEPSSAQVPAQR